MIDLDEFETPGKRYRAWVNNRMMVLAWDLKRNRAKDSHTLLKHAFFLEELEHHFMDCHAEPRIWRAFYYLQLYLAAYPQVKWGRVETAMKMLGLIYERLGFQGCKIFEAGQYGFGAPKAGYSHTPMEGGKSHARSAA